MWFVWKWRGFCKQKKKWCCMKLAWFFNQSHIHWDQEMWIFFVTGEWRSNINCDGTYSFLRDMFFCAQRLCTRTNTKVSLWEFYPCFQRSISILEGQPVTYWSIGCQLEVPWSTCLSSPHICKLYVARIVSAFLVTAWAHGWFTDPPHSIVLL